MAGGFNRSVNFNPKLITPMDQVVEENFKNELNDYINTLVEKDLTERKLIKKKE